MVRNPNEELGDRTVHQGQNSALGVGRGEVAHIARIPDRLEADRLAEADDAALRYFLRRTVTPMQIGEKATPRLCAYCGSSGIAISKRIGDSRVMIGKLQEIGEGKEVLCLYCHRVWRIELVGWE